MKPYTCSVNQVVDELDSSFQGLSHEAVRKRLVDCGLNTLPCKKRATVWVIFLRQFLSPFIYILLLAALLSLVLQEWSDAIFIVLVLLINAVIGTIQEYSAEISADSLHKMASMHAFVMRQGEILKIDASSLVPGDVCLIRSESKIPADMRLISTQGLEIDESLLTGESLSVSKNQALICDENTPLADRSNMVFAGSHVTRGQGRGIVTSTGLNTELGALAESLAEPRKAEPPLVRRIKKFTIALTLVLLATIVVFFTIEVGRGTPWVEILLVSIALAVSVIPEGLPVAMTIALSIGMSRMAKQNVIVRRLVATESLGSCTTLAADKTGTLTINEIMVKKIIIPNGDSLFFTGSGVEPDGSPQFNQARPIDEQQTALDELSRVAVLCNEGLLAKRDGQWTHQGDAVDVALLVMAYKCGIKQSALLTQYPLVSQIPYESERGFAASFHKSPSGTLICVKGAPEVVLDMCPDQSLSSQVEILAEEGYRVLAIAKAIIDEADVKVFDESHLKDLVCVGLIGMIDPLRPDAKEAVEKCRNAGIDVCMVTGDHPATAFTIAKELNIVQSKTQMVTGRELHAAKLQEQSLLDQLVSRAKVFARVSPKDKLDIVESLRRFGKFVAVTGDGANDVMAMNAAHLGIAMGKRGTDITKECADMIVTDDSLSSIAAGVEEGRIAYQNIRKVIFLLISTGAAELVLFVCALISGLPIPLVAVQLLWLNLITNGIQDIGLAFEPAEGQEMRCRPRNPKEPIFDRFMIERIVLSAVTMGGCSFAVYYYCLEVGFSVESARNYTMLTMVLFENIHILNSRSETGSIFKLNFFNNPLLIIGTLSAQLIHIGAMYTPWLGQVLGVHPVSFEEWVYLLLIALSVLVVIEIYKLFRPFGNHLPA